MRKFKWNSKFFEYIIFSHHCIFDHFIYSPIYCFSSRFKTEINSLTMLQIWEPIESVKQCEGKWKDNAWDFVNLWDGIKRFFRIVHGPGDAPFALTFPIGLIPGDRTGIVHAFLVTFPTFGPIQNSRPLHWLTRGRCSHCRHGLGYISSEEITFYFFAQNQFVILEILKSGFSNTVLSLFQAWKFDIANFLSEWNLPLIWGILKPKVRGCFENWGCNVHFCAEAIWSKIWHPFWKVVQKA